MLGAGWDKAAEGRRRPTGEAGKVVVTRSVSGGFPCCRDPSLMLRVTREVAAEQARTLALLEERGMKHGSSGGLYPRGDYA